MTASNASNANSSTLLIVDDESLVRFALGAVAERLGYAWLEAADGRQAEEILNDRRDVGLVITDIVMPNQEGVETIANIRRRWPSIKVIAISGGGRLRSGDFLTVARQVGAHSVIRKPFTADDFIRAVEESGYASSPSSEAPG